MTPREHARKMLVKRNHTEDRPVETVEKTVSETVKEDVVEKKTTTKKTAAKKTVVKTEEPDYDNVG